MIDLEVTDLEVTGMAELSTAVLTCEPVLVVVYQHVVVETVLACERLRTDEARKRLDTCKQQRK